MNTRPRRVSATYQVALPGRFGPAYLATFAEMGVRRVETSSVFLLPATGTGVLEVISMLQARGLVILDIRRVSTPGHAER
jgi:hypothetical protein